MDRQSDNLITECSSIITLECKNRHGVISRYFNISTVLTLTLMLVLIDEVHSSHVQMFETLPSPQNPTHVTHSN